MKPNSGITPCILAAFLCLAFGAVCHAQIYTGPLAPLGPNLVENGSFGELDGWTISGYAWYPSSGGEVGGYINFQGFAYQNIATQPGSIYLLQFWTQSSTPLAHVLWGSQDLGYFPTTSGLSGWEENQVTVTAMTTSTRLYFTADNPIAGVDLDEVGVFLVPEPDSAALFVSGFVIFLTFRFRRCRRNSLSRDLSLA